MIIELSDEIEQIIDDIQEPDSPESKAINKLFELMSENKHVVFASMQLLEKIRDFKYINSDNKKYIIENLLLHYVDLYSSLPSVKRKLIVKVNDETKIDFGDDICVNLNKCCKLNRAKLSAEHPDDAIFYKNIFNFLNKNNTYTVNFENNSFAGGNAESFLKAMDEELNIVLAISDSDKEYYDCEYGKTAQHVIIAVNSANKAIMDYYILGVREIENLIPLEFYETSNKNTEILLDCIKVYSSNEEFMRFVNLKDGISNNCVTNANGKWLELYDGFIQICKEKGIYNRTETIPHSKYCINGIGSKNSKEIMKRIFLKNNKYGLNFDIKKCAPNYIMNEWNNIYEYMMCYGCALKPTHNSFL